MIASDCNFNNLRIGDNMCRKRPESADWQSVEGYSPMDGVVRPPSERAGGMQNGGTALDSVDEHNSAAAQDLGFVDPAESKKPETNVLLALPKWRVQSFGLGQRPFVHGRRF